MTLYAVFEESPELDAVFQNGEELSADFEETTVIPSEQYRFGYGLKYDPNTRTVSVDAADQVAAGDNLRSRTGAGRQHRSPAAHHLRRERL